MPIYEYECDTCLEGQDGFEVEFSLADHSPEIACPFCHMGRATQIFRSSAYVSKMTTHADACRLLEKRSEDDAVRRQSDYVERVASGEAFGQGGVYSRKFQEKAFVKKGGKLR